MIASKRWLLIMLMNFMFMFFLTGCMTMRVVAKYDSDNPVPHKETKWNFVWGLIQPKDVKTEELCESICQLSVKNNLGYILISGITLGLVVPTSVEYQCCPFEPAPGEL